jgi:hypothetical protein
MEGLLSPKIKGQFFVAKASVFTAFQRDASTFAQKAAARQVDTASKMDGADGMKLQIVDWGLKRVGAD